MVGMMIFRNFIFVLTPVMQGGKKKQVYLPLIRYFDFFIDACKYCGLLCWTGSFGIFCANRNFGPLMMSGTTGSEGMAVYVDFPTGSSGGRGDLFVCEPCTICGKLFKNRAAFIRHKWQHRDSAGFRHQCFNCFRKFYRKDYLVKHLMQCKK